MEMFNFLIGIYTFIFGLCIGSFLNVCIYRLPESKSIIHPGSRCPKCNSGIRFYDNIPVLSYLWLKGRCRHCNAPISFRYPLIELLSGFFTFCVYLKYGLSIEGIVYFVFISSLLVITFIDIDHWIIPDIITLPGIAVFFTASLFLPSMLFDDRLVNFFLSVIGLKPAPLAYKIMQPVLGLLAGGGSLYFVAWAYALIKKTEGMGGGDIKLLAMIGVLLGWKGVIVTIFIGSAMGTLTGIIVMIYKRSMNMKLPIPFGPFLSIGAIVYIFFGPGLITWYIYMR